MTTKIEWCRNPDGSKGKTWNFARGCFKVGQGCANCYAIREAHVHAGHPHPKVRAAFEGLTVVQGGRPNWTGQVNLDTAKLDDPRRWRKPQRIFVNSLSDVGLLRVDVMAHMADTIYACPQHTFIALTKRPGDFGVEWDQVPEHACEFYGGETALAMAVEAGRWPPPNLWVLGSASIQAEVDEIAPQILKLNAAVRGLSLEPLLGPVDIRPWLLLDDGEIVPAGPSLDWVIVGGESGPGARPMHPQWARDIRDQCRAAAVPFFFKQWGEWDALNEPSHSPQIVTGNKKHLQVIGIDGKTGCTENPPYVLMARVGKKAAGRTLDGEIHDGMPGCP